MQCKVSDVNGVHSAWRMMPWWLHCACQRRRMCLSGCITCAVSFLLLASPLALLCFGRLASHSVTSLSIFLCSNTEGKYAYACGSTWADAYSFSGAAFEAYASVWADVATKENCNCSVSVSNQVDVVTSAWADIWNELYAALDDTACASSYGALFPYARCNMCRLYSHSGVLTANSACASHPR